MLAEAWAREWTAALSLVLQAQLSSWRSVLSQFQAGEYLCLVVVSDEAAL